MFIHDDDRTPRSPVRIHVERVSSACYTVFRHSDVKFHVHRMGPEGWAVKPVKGSAFYAQRHATAARAILHVMRCRAWHATSVDEAVVKTERTCYMRDGIGRRWLVVFYEGALEFYQDADKRGGTPEQDSALADLRVRALAIRARLDKVTP